MYVGFSNVVRGYDIGSFDVDECGGNIQQNCALVEDLIGSRLLVYRRRTARASSRGVHGHARIRIPAEILGFFDAGVAWDSSSKPSGFGDGTRPWARSVGAGARVNALGI